MPGSIQQHNAIAQIDTLLAFGNSWFVAGLGDMAAGQTVNQRRLADIGNARDHRQGIASLTLGIELIDQINNFALGSWFFNPAP